MEEVAFITALRFTRMNVEIRSSDNLMSYKSIPSTCIIEIIGQVTQTENSTLTINVEIHTEELRSDSGELAVSGNFTYSTISETSSTSHSALTIIPIQPNFVGGERELRTLLNIRLHPKTIARATLYNYLEKLNIRKVIYTEADADEVVKHISSLRSSRKKTT